MNGMLYFCVAVYFRDKFNNCDLTAKSVLSYHAACTCRAMYLHLPSYLHLPRDVLCIAEL